VLLLLLLLKTNTSIELKQIQEAVALWNELAAQSSTSSRLPFVVSSGKDF
jgi:hypothetical protein